MIRPFRIGDLFLVQRLGRQAVRLNTIQSLIEPQSSFWTSLFSAFPWNHAKVATHVLRQAGHGLLGDGFLQIRKRPTRPEVDIVCLSPGLVSDEGHPAIWEKLLGHYNPTAARQKIERIYADVPDQPLPVATFNRAGYRIYARQTIWRLSASAIDDYTSAITAHIRPQAEIDGWALHRLYAQTVPQPVQLAEGATLNSPLPIVQWPYPGVCAAYVVAPGLAAGRAPSGQTRSGQNEQEVQGAIQIVEGTRGVWLQLWADTNDPNPYIVHELLRHGLSIVYRRAIRKPVYVGVHNYQVGLNAILSDYGFAPVSDRAKMVRHVAHWVREVQPSTARVLESTPQIASVPYAPHTPTHALSRSRPRTQLAATLYAPLRIDPAQWTARAIGAAPVTDTVTDTVTDKAAAASSSTAASAASSAASSSTVRDKRGKIYGPCKPATLRRTLVRNVAQSVPQSVPLGHGNRQELYVKGI